jgi:PAS domain S-box-containing protein
LSFTYDKPVRIVHLEDVSDESILLENVVRKAGFHCHWKWVSSKPEYLDALRNFSPDIILSDHSMPGISSVEAFRLLQELGLDIPFILVTATVSEEFAVTMMKEGVADYVLKDRPQRLPHAIENALEKWDAERANRAFISRLIRSEANLQALMENSDANIYSLNTSLRLVAFNGQFKETVRVAYGSEAKVGDSVVDLIDALDAQQASEWKEIYSRALAGMPQHFIKKFEIHDTRLYMRFHVNPIIESGEITGVACLAIDITNEKLAEDRLAKSEARFRALTENNFDAIILGDSAERMTYASPSLGRMLGYSQEQLQQGHAEIDFHPEDRAMIQRVYDDALSKPNVPLPAVARVRHSHGHYIWAEGVITNMMENESVRGIVANYRDVTERKEAELHEAQMTRDLVQRNKDLEQFAYIVSHNLRGPVANILGISHILKESKAAENERAEALAGIFIATNKLDEVIIDLNRVLDTKKEVNDKKEMVSFQAIVDSIAVGIESIIQKNNVAINTDFTRISGILTIRSFLQSIFYNLISNSIKYKQPDTNVVINIASYPVDDGVRLVFSDNGMGIDLPNQGAKVFGLYKRFHPKHAEGKGMGLFMVKTQVESLGGEISIKSEVNKGTEFTIEL